MSTPLAEGAGLTSLAQVKRSEQKVSTGNYQPVILVEYVSCILLTALTPFASKKDPGLSPYAGKDMVKLAAITFLFFILALISATGRGPARVAAWVGGLILITDGLAEVANLAKDVAVFTGGSPAAPAAPVATAPVLVTGVTSTGTVYSTNPSSGQVAGSGT